MFDYEWKKLAIGHQITNMASGFPISSILKGKMLLLQLLNLVACSFAVESSRLFFCC